MDMLEQMKTFARIVDTGRISAAARSLGLSVAAVSRQLSALEEELGATLIVRSTRRLGVTDSGQRWYQHCTRLLDQLDAARSDVAEGAEVRGHVVVSAPASYAMGHLMSRVALLAKQHPHLFVELRLQDHAVDLIGDGVDVAVRAGMVLPDSASVIAHRLVTFRRQLVGSSAYLRRRGTPRHPSELRRHDLIVQTRAAASFTRWQFARDGEEVEVEPTPRLASTSPLALREWTVAGAGIALIPSWLTGGLKLVLPAWRTPPISVYALHRAELRGAARIRTVVQAFTNGMVDDA
jgi:DNA-binding transcriptional LysR family regulator